MKKFLLLVPVAMMCVLPVGLIAAVGVLSGAFGAGNAGACGPGGAVPYVVASDLDEGGAGPQETAGPDRRLLTDEQKANARIIISTIQGLTQGTQPKVVLAPDLSKEAAVVAIMTALQESGLRNLPYGDADSLGLFQQRESIYGRAVATDPVKSTEAFLIGTRGVNGGDVSGLLDVPTWDEWTRKLRGQMTGNDRSEVTRNDVASAVQKPADRYEHEYGKWEPLALATVTELWGDMVPCTISAVAEPAPRNADGSWPQELCSIRPDPTNGNGRGCITPRLNHLLEQATLAGIPKPGCFRVDDHGEHPKGRACDFMVTSGGEAVGAERALGDSITAWALANADRLGIWYVIWFKQIWNPAYGWRSYGDPYRAGGASGQHTNHVHISVY